jgi:hypothetical protein
LFPHAPFILLGNTWLSEYYVPFCLFIPVPVFSLNDNAFGFPALNKIWDSKK